MKKLITVFMALAMIFAMSIPAFAAETNVTINAEGDRTYAAYKLLNVTTSLIKGDHPEDCGGENNHVKGCYNYAYTINPDFYDILSEVTTKTNETDIIDAIKNAGDIQDLSNRIYRAIPENFAAAKCPSSWTKIRMLNKRIAKRMVIEFLA